MPIFEFEPCFCQGGKTDPVERLCKYDEKKDQKCDLCQRDLNPILSATPGFVWDGLSNKAGFGNKK